jgi:hypothetical protein
MKDRLFEEWDNINAPSASTTHIGPAGLTGYAELKPTLITPPFNPPI